MGIIQMIVNRRDIIESLQYTPSPIFNYLMLGILRLKMNLYENVKDVKTLQDQIKDYLGVKLVDGKLEPKPELDKVARDSVQDLIDIYNTM